MYDSTKHDDDYLWTDDALERLSMLHQQPLPPEPPKRSHGLTGLAYAVLGCIAFWMLILWILFG
jgi:hypothetical protein